MSDEAVLIVDEFLSIEEAQARLDAAGLGDGLPLIPPTRRRLAAMLEGVARPDDVLGHMAPLMGEVTVRAIAYNAVLAGCHRVELEVVVAAVTAMLAPEFNLLGIATTTGSAAVAVLVHGDVSRRLGVNAGINCLGPGHRANAAIGRAVSLCLRNIGGAREAIGDMATCGQPAKFGLCFAEGDDSTFESWHARRGLTGVDGGVTVLGISGTAEVLPLREETAADAVLEAIAIAMVAAVRTTGAYRQPTLPQQIVVLPPEVARGLSRAGLTLEAVQRRLLDLSTGQGQAIAPSHDAIHPIVAGGAGVKIAYLPLWGGGTTPVTRVVLGQGDELPGRREPDRT